MLRIALTGGIGSGKSAVSDLLAERGAIVIDADQIAREVVQPGSPGLAEVVKRFGEGVLDDEGALDRGALAGVVFSDPEALQDLNAIIHPRVAQRSAERLEAAPSDAVVVYDVPLLTENGAQGDWDIVLVVAAERETRIERLMSGRGMPRKDALERMAAQATDEDRARIADHVIDNDGSRAELESAVERFWRDFVVGSLP